METGDWPDHVLPRPARPVSFTMLPCLSTRKERIRTDVYIHMFSSLSTYLYTYLDHLDQTFPAASWWRQLMRWSRHSCMPWWQPAAGEPWPCGDRMLITQLGATTTTPVQTWRRCFTVFGMESLVLIESWKCLQELSHPRNLWRHKYEYVFE